MYIGNLKGKIVAVDAEYFLIDEQFFSEQGLPRKVVAPIEFRSSLQDAVIGNNVQLIDVTVDYITDSIIPKLVIVEPDYLLDVSSVAECMREYGSHPFYFLINRCSEKSNTAPILLGNAANFFLDELIYSERVEDVDANVVIKKYFQLYPLEVSSCKDLRERSIELQFFESLKFHFDNLNSIVQTIFREKNIDRKSVVLEPSFVCPNIGLQGRLDLLEYKPNGNSSVIELKSGKTPYGDFTNEAIGLNHQTQASLYQLMIQQVLQVEFSKLETHICYSRCSSTENPLRLAHPSMSLIAQALNIRNHIVLNDFKVAFKMMSPANLFANIVPERMIHNDRLDSKLISQYVAPYIGRFSSVVENSSELEKAYFFSYYQFLVKEQWLAKCGTEVNKERSLSALWTMDYIEKKELGMMMDGLQIIDKQAQYEYTVVRFSYLPNYEVIADFREGDIVVLYEKNKESDNVTTRQVFKGSIGEITDSEIVLRLRNHQHNQALPIQSQYAIEHDVLDNNYTAQFRGLYKFLTVSKVRKDMILELRKPEVKDCFPKDENQHAVDKIGSLIRKVENANDLFLLVGPPGTGKTSIALKSLVEHYYNKTDNCILLTAYTNRAVDEICAAIEKIEPTIVYVRLGSRINCPATYQKRLLGEQIKSCSNRREVQSFIQAKRVYIGTVASISSNTELLSDKHFELCIVDESSQILDAQILNILCSKNENGNLSVDKFVLIGDEKQLPAVCQQETEIFTDELLKKQGFISGKISFFERMLQRYKDDDNLVAILDKQGRMHPEIARFANHSFYDASLATVPLQHQLDGLSWRKKEYTDDKKDIAERRNVFFPIKGNGVDGAKEEAIRVSNIAKSILELYRENGISFQSKHSLGVITPFRSQIALIRKCLRDLNICEMEDIVVDTVERYQGSQKDIIIYAFGVYNQRQLQQVTDATIVCSDKTIDRKLNVALTRARKQFFFVGSDYWTQQNQLYRDLVHYLETGVL